MIVMKEENNVKKNEDYGRDMKGRYINNNNNDNEKSNNVICEEWK